MLYFAKTCIRSACIINVHIIYIIAFFFNQSVHERCRHRLTMGEQTSLIIEGNRALVGCKSLSQNKLKYGKKKQENSSFWKNNYYHKYAKICLDTQAPRILSSLVIITRDRCQIIFWGIFSIGRTLVPHAAWAMHKLIKPKNWLLKSYPPGVKLRICDISESWLYFCLELSRSLDKSTQFLSFFLIFWKFIVRITMK